jgi:hypothetical protein
MSTNGPETSPEPKSPPPPGNVAKNTRPPSESPAPGKNGSARRQRDRKENGKTNTEERFFLAEADGKSGVPALGRECPTEAEAIIEAFRAKAHFYRITEFQTRADIGTSGEPILKKEALKRNNPAS